VAARWSKIRGELCFVTTLQTDEAELFLATKKKCERFHDNVQNKGHDGKGKKGEQGGE
jgi:hypothetical protein